MAKTDQKRIVALQKALSVAKAALLGISHHGHTGHIDDVLEEIRQLEDNSKPPAPFEAHGQLRGKR